MAIRNLLLLILIVGSLVIFVLENMTPVVPLVILGTQTQAFPLAIWLLAAIAAGAITMLLIAGLIRLATVSPRSGNSRFYADRPQYRPTTAEPFDDDDDWEVIDVEASDRDRPLNNGGNGGNRYTSRPSSFSPDRYSQDNPSQDAQPSESRSSWFNRENKKAGDRGSSSSQPKSSRSNSTGSIASPLEDWDRFTAPRTGWEQWNAYEEAPSSFSNRNQADTPNRYVPEPETVIQDRADRDWQDWKDYREEAENDRVIREPSQSSRDDSNGGYLDDEYKYRDAYDDDAYDEIEDERRAEEAGDRYDDDPMDDEMGDRYDDDPMDDETEDIPYRSEWATYSTSTDSPDYAPADEGYDAIGYDDAGDYDAGNYNAEDYDAGDYQDASSYSDADDYEDVSEQNSSSWDNETSPGDAFYTVRYTEEDDYYDDYDDYVTASGRSPQSSGDRRSEEASDQQNASTDNDWTDDDLADFEDWEEEPQSSSDQAAQAEASEKPGRIYEVPQRPASVRQSGTVYSYRYRPSSEDERANAPTDSQSTPSLSEPENPATSEERADENDASNQATHPHPDASTSASSESSPESSEPRILTTPPPTDRSGSPPPPDQTS